MERQLATLLFLSMLAVSFKSVAAVNCTGVVCHNGGVCNNYTASPPCICPLPFIPPYCTAAANYCSTLQPDKGITELPVCQNGGNCTMTYTDPYFNCSCPSGYTGQRRCLTNTTTDSNTTTTSTTTTAASTSTSTSPSPSGVTTLAPEVVAGICVGVLLAVVIVVLIVILSCYFCDWCCLHKQCNSCWQSRCGPGSSNSCFKFNTVCPSNAGDPSKYNNLQQGRKSSVQSSDNSSGGSQRTGGSTVADRQSGGSSGSSRSTSDSGFNVA